MAVSPSNSCDPAKTLDSEMEKRATPRSFPQSPPPETFLSKMKQILCGESVDKLVMKEGNLHAKDRNRISDKKVGRSICGAVVLFTLFCCSTTAFVIMWFTDIYLSQILEQMTVHNGSLVYNSWKKPSFKPLICVYAFNYTNLEDYVFFRAGKMRIKETGPYCYRESLEKIHISFQEDGTVTYGNKRTHKFDKKFSRGSPDDILFLPNPVIFTAVSHMKGSGYIFQLLIHTAIRFTNSDIILKVKAHDFLFGYDDNLLRFAKGSAKLLQMDLPYDKFGILAIRAAETNNTLTVQTGQHDLEHIDTVKAFNNKTLMDIWNGMECNRIDGSDGAFFSRKDLEEFKTLYLFHEDICRKLPLVFEKYVDFQGGVEAMRYHLSPTAYNTEKTCYCDLNCPPQGVFDLSPCVHGIPLAMSFPHFLNGDPVLFKKISGLKPNKTLHDFYFDIHPRLGFTLGMISRLQMNIRVQKPPGDVLLRAFNNNMILPLVWVEVFADHLPDDVFRIIYHLTFTVKNAQIALKYGTLLATIISAFCIMNCLWKIIKTETMATSATSSPSVTTLSFPPYAEKPKLKETALQLTDV